MMTKDGLMFEACILTEGRLQTLTRQQLQAHATQNCGRRWVTPDGRSVVAPLPAGVVPGELAGIFERLGSNAENWQARLQKLAAGRLLGRFFAASRARLREVAERLGVHHLANLGGCAAR